MEFPSLDVFKQPLKDYSINIGRNFKFVKNDKDRVLARCPEDKCEWEIYYTWSNETNSW